MRVRASRVSRAAARRIVYSLEENQEIPAETSKKNVKWRGRQQKSFKYVDDNLQVNIVNMETAVAGVSDEGSRYRDKHGVECQNSFRTIVRKAEQ